jgi:anti-sigma B factor antagonist
MNIEVRAVALGLCSDITRGGRRSRFSAACGQSEHRASDDFEDLAQSAGRLRKVADGLRQKGLGMDFRITDGPIDATTHVIQPHGEIDLDSAPGLKATLDAATAAGARHVLVDFQDVAFLDSKGIGVLLSAQRKLRARDGTLIVVCDDPLLRRIFDITGLTDVLNVRPSCREALLAAQEFAAAS